MTVLVAVIMAILAILFGYYANKASREEGNRRLGAVGTISMAVIAFLLGLIGSYSRVFCVILALVILLPSWFNKEGKYRAASWTTLLTLDCCALIMAIAGAWDGTKVLFPKARDFIWVLIPIAVIVFNIQKGKRLDRINFGNEVAEKTAKKLKEQTQS